MNAGPPPELREALAGRPSVGEWDAMFPFLTVDAAGFPHVCLLSRSELAVDDEHVYAVLASRTTIGNVRRDRRATLVAVGPDAAAYAKLTVAEFVADGSWLGVVCAVDSTKRDTLGIPLQPPRYLPTSGLAAAEDWDRAARLLARLVRPSPPPTRPARSPGG